MVKSRMDLALKLLWRSAVVLSLLVCPSFAGEHQPLRFRVALISIVKPSTTLPQVRGLRDGLEEAGYVNGENIVIYQLHGEDIDSLRQRLKQLVQQGLDVIVASSTIETAIAQRLTNKIPIVFSPAIHPVHTGLVKSRSHPGANLTGLSFNRGTQDLAKQLSVFIQVIPAMRHVTMFYDRRQIYKLPTEVRSTVERIAQDHGIHLTQVDVESTAEAVRVLERTSIGATDGVFVMCTALFRELKPLSNVAARKRLPLFGCTTSQVADEGATMTYAPDLYLIGYRGAWYVDRILNGAKPEQLPVETPSKMELVINLQNARSIGVKIPSEQLILADRVFQ